MKSSPLLVFLYNNDNSVAQWVPIKNELFDCFAHFWHWIYDTASRIVRSHAYLFPACLIYVGPLHCKVLVVRHAVKWREFPNVLLFIMYRTISQITVCVIITFKPCTVFLLLFIVNNNDNNNTIIVFMIVTCCFVEEDVRGNFRK